MGTVGAFACQRDHLPAQRTYHQRRIFAAQMGTGALHGIEIIAHGGERLAIGMAMGVAHDRLVGHAQPHHETIAIERTQTAAALHAGHGVASVDIGNAAGDRNLLGVAQQETAERKAFVVIDLGIPDRLIAQGFDMLRSLREFGSGKIIRIQKYANAVVRDRHVRISPLSCRRVVARAMGNHGRDAYSACS